MNVVYGIELAFERQLLSGARCGTIIGPRRILENGLRDPTRPMQKRLT
jgi:hypothetical protein